MSQEKQSSSELASTRKQKVENEIGTTAKGLCPKTVEESTQSRLDHDVQQAQASEPPKSETKTCRECGNSIPLMARKCTECDSYQDWRQFLPFSSTILSLLIALFAVLGTLIQSIHEYTKDQDAKIHGVLLDSRTGTIDQKLSTIYDLFITNAGSKPGAIKSVSLRFNDEPWTSEYLLTDALQRNVDVAIPSAVIEASSSRILAISFPRAVNLNPVKSFTIRVEYFQFSGGIKSFDLTSGWPLR